ncbi:hypothetical protein N7478_004356 [Penicillium angulare]|uniref:uncharacterized protein n=1 Tax=Penicillium angulare TaxID=116970 RepID=UPI002541954B|nr:uncharacterized protein N7478_004356 [Penicillium angulare]KAJ5278984.1 hypothetical protein N7478_004356 [Penicillium angulare]
MSEKKAIGQGKVFPPQLPSSDGYAVEFDGPDDPTHPYNWKLSLNAVFAPGTDNASKEFGVSSEVGALATSLYVLGFACGPMIWAPASELRGRKWPLTIAMLGGSIFTIGSAVAKDIQTLIICRFFAGMCAASQLTVVPGVLADVFDNTYRGVAISVYALTVFVGPFTAPFIGGFITSSYLGWRWTLYLPAILSFVNGVISVVFLRETYAPCLLIAKAVAIRRQTGNWGIHAKQEKIEIDFMQLMEKYFTRPLRMLITEPIILLVSMYMSFIYGLVYALLEAYPYVFQHVHGMALGVEGLPFIGLIIGQVLACTFIVSQHKNYARKLAENKNVPVPEWRLSPTILGAPVFTIGIFWFGWTGFTPAIHWAAPTAAGIFIGFGVLCVFLPCFNYLVDSYLPLAASTVAANIILRSSIAAGFPLFTKQMFENMGIQWACTLLACLAAIMIPIPIAFRAYGPQLRAKSKLFK